ncbi:MAG: HAMP domain-containing protein, partial [Myxococcota bacterium]
MSDVRIRPRPIRPFRSIRFRVLATVLAALTALVGALVFLMLEQQSIAKSQALIDEAYLPILFQVEQAKSEWTRVDNDVRRLVDDERRPRFGDFSPADLYTRRLVEALHQCRSLAWQARDDQAVSGSETAVVKRLELYLDKADELAVTWRDKALRLAERLEAGDREGASELEIAFRSDAGRLGEELGQLWTFVQQRLKVLRSSAKRRQTRANTIAFTLAAIGLGLSVVMIATVSGAVSSVGRLTTQVQRLAEGEHGGLVEVRGEDEVGLLAGEFNRMVQALALRDATLVRRAEQLNRLSRYLANVLDSLQDGLFVVEHGVVTLANPAAERQWKVQREAEAPTTVRPFLEAPGLSEHRLGPLTVEVRVMPFGEAGFIVLTTDVTEQRKALDQLARSERLASMGQMLAQITHEV